MVSYMREMRRSSRATQILFTTCDLHEVRERVSRMFCEHDIHIESGGAQINAEVQSVCLGKMSISRLSYGAAIKIIPRLLEDFYLVQLPLTGKTEVVSGKERVCSHSSFATVLSPTLPISMHWYNGCAQAVLKIDRKVLERYCITHLGRELSKPVEFSVGMEIEGSSRIWRHLVNLLSDETSQAVMASPLVTASLEQMLVGALLFLQPSNYYDDLHRPTTTVAPYYVKRVEDYIHANADQPVTIAELAAHAGVSARALYSGFKSYRGVSPMAFLKAVRLERVRRELLEAVERRETVTTITMRWGFTHLGHFTADYRERFGEKPSDTLRRSYLRA